MSFTTFLLGQPRYRPDTPWRASWALVATFFILVAAQFMASWLFPLLGGVSSNKAAIALPDATNLDSASIAALMLWLLLVQTSIAVLVVGAASLFGGSPVRVLKLGRIDGGVTSLGYAIGLMVVLLVVFNALLYWLRPSDVTSDMQLYVTLVRSDAWPQAALAIGLGAPIMEEFLFRGFLQSALARTRMGFAPAAVLTTAGWAALHWGYSAVGLLEVAMIGVYFSWLLWRTGSLWPALVCHALYNSALMMLLRYAPV